MVSALVLFWILVLAVRDVDTVDQTLAYGRVMRVGTPVVMAGVVGTILFGVWLAVALDRYRLWDGWIVAALLLWALGTWAGMRADAEYRRPVVRAEELRAAAHQEGQPGELRALNRSPAGFRMHTISSVAVILVLVDMIWKPGA